MATKISKKLILVESPTKVHTISQFLDKSYTVRATMGHVIDLPKSKLGLDEENNFEPHYIVMRDKSKILKEITAYAAKADTIYFATDPDREGEAISYHIRNKLKTEGKTTHRIVFHEITKKAILGALEAPRDIDINLVNAQQGRRILDRLVGYKISPMLWKNVQGGLSAGRVQSVALRMICEREREITAFKPVEYWSLIARLKAAADAQEFNSKLIQVKGEKAKINTKEEGDAIIAGLQDSEYIVKRIEAKERNRNATPPFITSTLQQEASKKLGYTAKRTMMLAQQLYEGMNVGEEGVTGLITYMRTDSMRVADEAIVEVRQLIKDKYGEDSLPEKPNTYKNKKSSQDAHEAIRPSSVLREPGKMKQYMTPDQFKLYDLIWKRFVASQMKSAILEVTTIDITAGECLFRATGNVIKFKGFLSVYEIIEDEKEKKPGEEEEESAEEKNTTLPKLTEGQKLLLVALIPEQHFTQPPPRYNDASLVKALEENNIGRPSTYAAIISTILDRNYVERLEKRFKPTDLGILVNDILVKTFPDIFNIEFTAKMEEELDKVEEGTLTWQAVVKEFYVLFGADLEKAAPLMESMKKDINSGTDEICEKCQKPMVIKWGSRGKFIACSGYPECKNTKSIPGEGGPEPEPTNIACDKCGAKMITKFSRFGKFLACEKYPECKNTKSIGIGIKCPKCGGDVVSRRGKKGSFYGCSNYPKCDFITNAKPVARACTKCGYPVTVVVKGNIKCLNAECKHEEVKLEDKPADEGTKE
ncbi:MAG: type I DNA topoisomerase [Candidatus Firestonebacteria bacterium]